MNRVALDALGAVAADFYARALEEYPCLLLDAGRQVTDEAMVVWGVLLAIDELAVEVCRAMAFDEASQGDEDRDAQELLPF